MEKYIYVPTNLFQSAYSFMSVNQYPAQFIQSAITSSYIMWTIVHENSVYLQGAIRIASLSLYIS